MAGHIFSKLYVITLHLMVSDQFERRHLRARRQAGFCLVHEIIDHIFILKAIIKEVRHHSLKVSYCSVDFLKAFDLVPRMTSLDCFMTLAYQRPLSLVSCACTSSWMSSFVYILWQNITPQYWLYQISRKNGIHYHFHFNSEFPCCFVGKCCLHQGGFLGLRDSRSNGLSKELEFFVQPRTIFNKVWIQVG